VQCQADCPRAPDGLSAWPRRTVCEAAADGLKKYSQTSNTAQTITDCPWRHLGPSATNTPHADCPRILGGPSAKLSTTEDGWKIGSKGRRSRTSDEHEEHQASRLHVDHPRPTCGLSATCGQSSPSPKPRSQPFLPIHGSPKRFELLRKYFGEK
jgi:hypothetical protein